MVKMKILVAEDDVKIAAFIEKGLKEDSYIVDLTHNGDKASYLSVLLVKVRKQ